MDLTPFSDPTSCPGWLQTRSENERIELKTLLCAGFAALREWNGPFGHPRFGEVLSKPAMYINPQDVTTESDNLVDRAVAKVLGDADAWPTLNKKGVACFRPARLLASEEASPEATESLLNGTADGWIVDPLCGSANVRNGIQLVATNIVLMIGGTVRKVCVADHLNRRLFLGVHDHGGEGIVEIRVGEEPFKVRRVPYLTSYPPQMPWCVDICQGYAHELGIASRNALCSFAGELMMDTRFQITMWRTSLAFAFVATGQLQGAVFFNLRPWDLIAACALVEWNGGVVTNLDGSPWSLRTRSAILASSSKVHSELLQMAKHHSFDLQL